MRESVETVVIGAGQAGLAMSYCLSQHGCEHVVLEQADAPATAWRDDRWDSFTLVTPNWAIRMPGAEYRGDDPHGFMPRADVFAYLEAYVRRQRVPVRYHTRVIAVEATAGRPRYRVTTQHGAWAADYVVMATGFFRRPRIPGFAANLPADITQLPAGQYRNPDRLPPGAVLVVGSAQSGCQVAEELYQSGRKVFLSVGRAGRVPRRYRGKDIFEWLALTGFLDRTAAHLPSPQARFGSNPHLSGKAGGHTLNLHQFARDGVVLLGHIQSSDGHRLRFAPDLAGSLAAADRLETDLLGQVDGYISKNGLPAPAEEVPQLSDGYTAPIVEELDLRAAGVANVIWACGYLPDFSIVRLPAFDVDGFPIQATSPAAPPATPFPGLFFTGLPWLPGQKTGLLLGVGEPAAAIAGAIAARTRQARPA